MNETMLLELLTGKTVRTTSANGEDVEFFLEDMGIDKVSAISQTAIKQVQDSLANRS
tara:strand:+ start:17933 stop:18103 length:171 start_codon:yes stop_codon:yes gene_type:complete